ncbi:cytochrome P450 [Rhizodiscina lignyota]|uniref:Cytochrome P450 n=1 Tax=Rhizodiscina lignyota TaxID=1504668 RepID=A0A9P4ITK2_9PEZI|nr:cytochrome P450 [Rhizodiscina lignyota]
MYILLLFPALAALVFIRFLYNVFRHDLYWIPGPFFVRFSNIWRFIEMYRARYADNAVALHHKYGKIVRTGPNHVSVADPDMIDQIYGHRQDYPKSDMVVPWQKVVNGKIMTGIVDTRDRKRHSELKRPVASIYSMSSIANAEDFISDTIAYFVKRLDESFISGLSGERKVPMAAWVQYFAFDAIGELTISRRFGFLETGADPEDQLGQIDRELEYRAVIGTMPWTHYLIKGNWFYRRFIEPTTGFILKASNLIKDRAVNGSTHPERRDMMARFIEAQKAHPDIVDDNVLRAYITTNLVAGSDTTAVVMRAAIYYAIRNPHVMKRVQQELDDNNVTYPLQYKTSIALPYVDAFINEVLRYHPVASIPLERVVPPEGMPTPFGHRLPGGVVVSMTPWVTNFDTEIFGVDAEKFNPERWLQGEKESHEASKHRLSVMRANEFSFSKGPRKCLGIHVAQQELWKCIPTLLGLFDITLAEPQKEWKVKKQFVSKQSEMDVILQWRPGKSLKDVSHLP